MTVPTYDRFIEPILRYLASHPEGASAKDVHDAAADLLEISEMDRQELVPSGAQQVYKNRAGWAHDRLKRAGLSTSIRRGYWKLTSEGFSFANQHPAALSDSKIEKLAIGYIDVRLRPQAELDTLAPHSTALTAPIAAVASPEERLGDALREIREAVTSELLEQLTKVSPSFFESIVLDVLHKMGYGANRNDIQRVGGSGDGGIDGVISLDRLGLEKVYVQAKRWQNAVGRPEIQAFFGAIAGQRANKGVFITTSAYTSQALDFARTVEKIVLIDGIKLAELMIECEAGVSTRTLKIPRLDSDYFDEESI